jgi:hypothetical protein
MPPNAQFDFSSRHSKCEQGCHSFHLKLMIPTIVALSCVWFEDTQMVLVLSIRACDDELLFLDFRPILTRPQRHLSPVFTTIFPISLEISLLFLIHNSHGSPGFALQCVHETVNLHSPRCPNVFTDNAL